MRINPLLLVTAILYGVAGLALTFAPQELLSAVAAPSVPSVVWLMELFGAALLALACLNWLQRYAVVGGVLGRPVLLANLLLVVPAFFSTVRHLRSQGGPIQAVAGVVLGVLAVAFGARLFGPSKGRTREGGAMYGRAHG